MSSYGYGPPPPPPSASPAGYGHPSGPYPQHTSARGGGQHQARGRGGHYGGRGDYHASPPARYDYGGQQPYQGHQQPAAYGAAQPPPSGYQQPAAHWAPDPSHGQHQQHQHHAHAPQPLSAANYHPNYAPQTYSQSAPYAQPAQPAYGSAQQYGPAYPGPSPPNVPHWSGPAPSQPPAYASSRGRGGYGERVAPEPQHGGPRPVRPGYEHEQVPPVAHGSYSQPYPHDPRASHYPPQHYAYAAPPPPPEPVARHEPYYVQSGHNRRGRGGRDHGGSGRGRGGHSAGHHGAEKARHQQRKPSHQENGQKKPTEAPGQGKKKKRKTNTLGLTPGNESESEDDEGEEKMLTDLIGKEALVVKDVAAYLAERRKHFPTKARVEAKQAAELARTEEDKEVLLQRQADKLRKQLRKVESSIKRKREQGDEGDEMRDSSAEESSDDGKPEVMSSKSPKGPALPPPAKKADITKHCKYYSTGGSCGKKGKCRFRHDPEIREAAMKEREANNGRLTIQQRLILNDKDQEDLTVLQSIQYLREKGMMSAADAEAKVAAERASRAEVKPEVKQEQQTPAKPQPVTTSLLPAAPPSLPAPPAKREPPSNGPVRQHQPPSAGHGADSGNIKDVKNYQGWLLKPYGGKSDDLP